MNVSWPVKPVLGVYVIVPSALSTTVPLVGFDTVVIVKVSPSISKSLARATITTGLFSSVVAVSSTAVTVLSLLITGNTSIVSVAVSQACGVPLSQTV